MKLIRCIPYLPVYNIKEATDFYKTRFGFSVPYHEETFAKLTRDDAEIHLWAASDESWKMRSNISAKPIISGAESFLPGTASCRIEVLSIQELFEEYQNSGVLYSLTTKVEAQPWGTLEFPTLDLHCNLLTFLNEQLLSLKVIGI